MHGISFSAYTKGQKPGDELTREQIEHRMAILAPRFNWIRSFSTTQGNEHIPQVAKAMGLKTLVGAWLGEDADKNRNEVDKLIELAQAGAVDVAAVGNEVLYRGDLDETELLDFMAEVRERLPSNVPMGYVDAYYEFEDRPQVTEACDVLLTNCYPFWEGCALPMQRFTCRTCIVECKKSRTESASSFQRLAGQVLVETFTALSHRYRGLPLLSESDGVGG